MSSILLREAYVARSVAGMAISLRRVAILVLNLKAISSTLRRI